MSDGDSISANIVSFLIWPKACGSVGAVGKMPTTDAAGGKVVHYFKECPVDGSGCKGSKWKKYNWGYSKDDLMERFKEHLYNKHRISGSIAESAIARAEYCTYTEDPPHSPPPAPAAAQLLPPPNPKKSLSEKQEASAKMMMKAEAADEPPTPSAEAGEAIVELGRVDTTIANSRKLF